MAERKIIIFTALEIERRAVARAVKHVAQSGEEAREIEIITIGIRGVRSSAWQSALRSARQSGGVTLIVAGLGGGLYPGLRAGDVVIDAADEPKLQDLPFHFGSIHTSADLICTAGAKSDLFRSTGALAVDMETASVRKVADEYGLPVIGVRAISDAADAAIDPELLSLVDDIGRPRTARLAMAILRRPSLAARLAQLGRKTTGALDSLEIAMQQVVKMLLS